MQVIVIWHYINGELEIEGVETIFPVVASKDSPNYKQLEDI